jgi:ribosomal protein L11 methylase PrmA
LAIEEVQSSLIIVKNVFGTLAVDLAQGFGALLSAPVLRILAGISETITTKHSQHRGYEYQQNQPAE